MTINNNKSRMEKLSTQVESLESIGKIIEENEDKIIDPEQYKNFLDVKLTIEQKNSLLNNVFWINEIKELSIEQRKDILSSNTKKVEQVWENIKKWNEINNEWTKEQKETRESAEKLFDSLENWEVPKNITQAKKLVENVTDLKENIPASWFETWEAIWNFFKKLWEFISKIGEFIKKLLIDPLMGLIKWKATIEATEKLVNKIETKDIEAMKSSVYLKIEEKYWDKITEDNKQKIKTMVDSLDEEQLKNIYESYKKWELDMNDIEKILPRLWETLFTREQIEEKREEVIQKVTESLKNTIKEKYAIDLNLDEKKLKELEILIRNNINLSEKNILVFQGIIEKQEFKYWDLFDPSKEVLINTWSILFGLVLKGILPPWAVVFKFAENTISAWVDMIEMSASALWFSWFSSFDDFQKQLEWLSEEEKAVARWMLYRKWGLFFDMVWVSLSTAVNLWIWTVSNTSLSKFDAYSANLTWNFDKKIKNFENLAKTLGDYEDINWTLNNARANILKIADNTKAIKILEDAIRVGKVEDAIIKLEWIKHFSGIDKNIVNNVDSLQKYIHNNIQIPNTTLTGKIKASTIQFWVDSEIFKLTDRLEKIWKAQKNIVEGNSFAKNIGRYRELVHTWEIWRIADKLTLNYSSVAEAKIWISNLNALAKTSPWFIKGIFDVAPIIFIAWVAANSEKPFFEELKKELTYFMPLVWPIQMFADSWWEWKNWLPTPTNIGQASMSAIFFGIDWAIMTNYLLKGQIAEAGAYLARPVTSSISFARWTANTIYNLGKVWVKETSINTFKATIKSVKNMGWWAKAKAAALLLLVWYFGIEAILDDNNLEEIFSEEWFDYKKMQEQANNLDDKDKEICINYIMEQTYKDSLVNLKEVEFRVKNNSLYIKSDNPDIKAPWFIEKSLYYDLWLNPPKEDDFIYIWSKENA